MDSRENDSREGDFRPLIREIVKNYDHEWVACHLGISKRELIQWLQGQRIRSMIIHNARILFKYIKSDCTIAFTLEEMQEFWTFMGLIKKMVDWGLNPISEACMYEIANAFDLQVLRTWQNIYHWLIRRLAWKLYGNYHQLNISFANRVILTGGDHYNRYINVHGKKDDIEKRRELVREVPFQYLERVFIQYRHDSVPIYLYGTRAYSHLAIVQTIPKKEKEEEKKEKEKKKAENDAQSWKNESRLWRIYLINSDHHFDKFETVSLVND